MDQPSGRETQELQRVAELLREIEDEALRLVEGVRGASVLTIISRAASARRHLDHLLEKEPAPDRALATVGSGYLRRIRAASHDLGLSVSASANLVGITAEEMAALMAGSFGRLRLDEVERVAVRLEAEQQLAML